jgi:hypothetical protein
MGNCQGTLEVSQVITEIHSLRSERVSSNNLICQYWYLVEVAGTLALQEVLVARHGHVEGVHHAETMATTVLAHFLFLGQQLPVLHLGRKIYIL